LISVTLLPARLAMSRSRSGLIERSWVATIAQLFFVRQAGSSILAEKASTEAKTCDLARKAASAFGRSAAKSAGKAAFSVSS